MTLNNALRSIQGIELSHYDDYCTLCLKTYEDKYYLVTIDPSGYNNYSEITKALYVLLEQELVVPK